MEQRAEYRHMNVFDIEEVWDVVLLIEVLEHIPKAEIHRFVGKIRDMLDPNGSLVLSVPTPLAPMLHPGHVQHFTADSLSKVLTGPGLQITKIVYHLNVRLSHYSRCWRRLLRLFDNRILTIKPALRMLGALHWQYALRAQPKYGCRIVARVTRVPQWG